MLRLADGCAFTAAMEAVVAVCRKVFVEGQDACIVIGKPSLLAHAVLNRLKNTHLFTMPWTRFRLFTMGFHDFPLRNERRNWFAE